MRNKEKCGIRDYVKTMNKKKRLQIHCFVALMCMYGAVIICGTDANNKNVELHVEQLTPATIDFYVVNNSTNTIVIAGPDAMVKGAADQTYWLTAVDSKGGSVKPLLNACYKKARTETKVDEKKGNVKKTQPMTKEELEKARSMTREEFERLCRANPTRHTSGPRPRYEQVLELPSNVRTTYIPVELNRWFSFRFGEKYSIRVHLQISEKAKVIESPALEVTAK